MKQSSHLKYLKKPPRCHTLSDGQRKDYRTRHGTALKFLDTVHIALLHGTCKETARRTVRKIRKRYSADRTTSKLSIKHYCAYFGLNPTDVEHYLNKYN